MIWRFYPLDSSTLQTMRGSQDAQNSSSNCPDPSLQTQVMRKTFKELWCSRVTVWRVLHTLCREWQSANGKGRGMGICWRCRRVEGGCSIQGGSPWIILLSTMRSLRIWGSLLLSLHFTGKLCLLYNTYSWKCNFCLHEEQYKTMCSWNHRENQNTLLIPRKLCGYSYKYLEYYSD